MHDSRRKFQGRLFDRLTSQRLKITDNTVSLDRRRLFIFPTRVGFMYAATLGVMLLFALNYNNSMVFVTTFLLAAIAVHDIWQTHQNLLDINVLLLPSTVMLANRTTQIGLSIESGNIKTRHAIEVNFTHGNDLPIQVDVHHESNVAISLTPLHRGRQKIPQIRISTVYPHGLFRAWSLLRFPGSLIVAPAPMAREIYPLYLPLSPVPSFDSGQHEAIMGEDQISGLRPYQSGDPPRSIAWRASARNNSLISKSFHGNIDDRIRWLRWEDIQVRDVESRLSILCRWVLDAEKMGLRYGLAIPGRELVPGNGPKHREACLEALALYLDKP